MASTTSRRRRTRSLPADARIHRPRRRRSTRRRRRRQPSARAPSHVDQRWAYAARRPHAADLIVTPVARRRAHRRRRRRRRARRCFTGETTDAAPQPLEAVAVAVAVAGAVARRLTLFDGRRRATAPYGPPISDLRKARREMAEALGAATPAAQPPPAARARRRTRRGLSKAARGEAEMDVARATSIYARRARSGASRRRGRRRERTRPTRRRRTAAPRRRRCCTRRKPRPTPSRRDDNAVRRRRGEPTYPAARRHRASLRILEGPARRRGGGVDGGADVGRLVARVGEARRRAAGRVGGAEAAGGEAEALAASAAPPRRAPDGAGRAGGWPTTWRARLDGEAGVADRRSGGSARAPPPTCREWRSGARVVAGDAEALGWRRASVCGAAVIGAQRLGARRRGGVITGRRSAAATRASRRRSGGCLVGGDARGR